AWYWLDSTAPFSRNHKPFRITSQDFEEPHLAFTMFCTDSALIDTTVASTETTSWLNIGPEDFSKRWTHLQGYFRESSPGASDGVLRFWIDGNLEVDKALATRTSSVTHWEDLWIGH